MKIQIEKPDESELEKRGVRSWPVWEKEISRFDWHYDETEECFLLEGEVTVETEEGESVTFGAGDFVTFPKDIFCVWDIKSPVKSIIISNKFKNLGRISKCLSRHFEVNGTTLFSGLRSADPTCAISDTQS